MKSFLGYLFIIWSTASAIVLLGRLFPQFYAWGGYFAFLLGVMTLAGSISAYYLATDTDRYSPYVVLISFLGAFTCICLSTAGLFIPFEGIYEISFGFGLVSSLVLLAITFKRFDTPIVFLSGGGGPSQGR